MRSGPAAALPLMANEAPGLILPDGTRDGKSAAAFVARYRQAPGRHAPIVR